MLTPDFNPSPTAASTNSPTLTSVGAAAKAALPLLAPIPFVPSPSLWRLTLAGSCLFGLSVGVALWPFLADYPALGLLLLLMLAWIGYSLQCAHRSRFSGVLGHSGQDLSERGWILQTNGEQQDRRMQLNGEVLIWPGLVILPLTDGQTQQPLRLVLAADSVTAADFARLRTWLRRSLVPKA